MRRGLLLAVVLLSGCQTLPEWTRIGQQSSERANHPSAELTPDSRRIVLNTQPPGGSVLIEPLGRQLGHGTAIDLMHGSYQLTASLTGYRSGSVQLQVGDQSDLMIVVPLGEGFTRVLVESEPPEAILSIDGKSLGNTPFSAEVSAGAHQIGLELDGFEPLLKSVVLAPGSQRSLHFELQSNGNLAAIEIDTIPSGALLRLDGRIVGHAPLTLIDIPPKRYQLTGELVVGGHTRLLGKADLDLQPNQRRIIALQLGQRETRYGAVTQIDPQRILDLNGGVDQNLKLEVEPFDTDLSDTDALTASIALTDALRLDFTNARFSQAIYRLLRPGDNIEFFQQQREVGRLQKLAEGTEAGFTRQLSKLGIQATGSRALALNTQQQSRLHQLIFEVYGQRGGYPLLALNSEQLSSNRLEIQRQQADGEIVILASGDGVVVEGSTAVAQAQGIRLFRLPADDRALQLHWRGAAPRLLVTAADSPDFGSVEVPSSLALGEKKILKPLSGLTVDWLNELTAGAGIRGWRDQRLSTFKQAPNNLLAPVIEIGPHERPGAYQRIWVVRYRHRGGFSQRQLSLNYSVGLGRQVFVSDQFLRRDGFAKTELPEVQLPRAAVER